MSEVEQLMLLHEFFTNSAFYLSANEGLEIDDGYEVVLAESIAKKLMILLCLMISQLIKLNIIKIGGKNTKDDIHNYNNELQVLLIGWIGKVPEARQLYFEMKSLQNEQREENAEKNSPVDPLQRNELLTRYSGMSALEIDDDLDVNTSNERIIDEFARRIELGLLAVLSKGKTGKSFTIQEDFHTFMVNFNTLCKIERFAEYLFEKFEAVITSGDVADLGGIWSHQKLKHQKRHRRASFLTVKTIRINVKRSQNQSPNARQSRKRLECGVKHSTKFNECDV